MRPARSYPPPAGAPPPGYPGAPPPAGYPGASGPSYGYGAPPPAYMPPGQNVYVQQQPAGRPQADACLTAWWVERGGGAGGAC